jgi:hypothetical protein
MPRASILQQKINIGGQEWTLEEILNALPNLGRDRGDQFITNPLSAGGSFKGRESSQFAFDPRSGQIVFKPTDTWSDKYGAAPGSMSVMYLKTPQGNVPVPVTRQEVEAFAAAPTEIQQQIANMSPQDYDAFKQYVSAGAEGAGVRADYPYPTGQAQANPLGAGLAEYGQGFMPQQISEQTRARRAAASAAVERAGSTPEASGVIKLMIAQGLRTTSGAPNQWGEVTPDYSGVKTALSEFMDRTGAYSGWGLYGSTKQNQIVSGIGANYDEMIQNKAYDIASKRDVDAATAKRLAERQLRSGYLGSRRTEAANIGTGLSTWG